MELQTHLVNKFVIHALGNRVDFSARGDRYTNFLTKIRDTENTTVKLSADEVETLLHALLSEMQNYVSVRIKEYSLKEKAA